MNKKLLVIAVAAVLALAAALGAVWFIWGEKPTEGSKAITIEVVDREGKSTLYELQTEAEYLRQAMEEAEGLEFDGANGMVLTVNGQTADYDVDSSYWALYVNGSYGNYGIDTQPVGEGDAFRIVYTVG